MHGPVDVMIRKPRVEELGKLVRLWREMIEDYGGSDGLIYDDEAEKAWLSYVERIITRNTGSGVLVAEVDGEIVGYLLYQALSTGIKSRYAEQVYISDLVVDRRFRRRGIATLLLKKLLNDKRGVDRRVFLRVPARNNAAINLYAKHGFRISEYVMELVVASGKG
jgi:ribosomal protein S18 acetylase RimI-like enzyme